MTSYSRSSTSWIRRAKRFAIYVRDGFNCVYCQGVSPLAYDGVGLTIDHVIPRFMGGTNKPNNLVTCCAKCNRRKQTSTDYWVVPGVRPGIIRARVQRQLAKPLNQEAGRLMAIMADRFRRDSNAKKKPEELPVLWEYDLEEG